MHPHFPQKSEADNRQQCFVHSLAAGVQPMFDRTDEMRADARVACVDVASLHVVTMLCSVAVRSDWLECQVKSGCGGGGGERGAVGITFANIATYFRFAIGCICVVGCAVTCQKHSSTACQAGETGISGFPQFSREFSIFAELRRMI
jgi:hypothetical protein